MSHKDFENAGYMYKRMSRVQASVLTFLLIAVLFAPLSVPAVGPVDAAVEERSLDGTAVVGSNSTVDGASPTQSLVGAATTAPGVTAIDADRVEFRITVYENGSATWTFTYTRTLDGAEEREQFETFAAQFNEEETEVYADFKRRAAGLTETGSDMTEREMAATEFEREAFLGGDCIETDRCGTVRMSFVWTDFARQDGAQLVVDDVFDGGLYIGDSQRLVFERGPGLQFVNAAPEVFVSTSPELESSVSITWYGEQQFSDRRPRVVFTSAEDGSPSVNSPAPTETETQNPVAPVEGSSSMWMIVVGLLVVAMGAGLALVWRRSGGSITIGGEQPGVSSEPAVAEEELLSDEDRVLQLLRDNGGRMKQVNIVEETGWSKSKVSMLLSDMEEDEQISKLRVGRENIVSLVGHEPDAAGSPHDE